MLKQRLLKIQCSTKQLSFSLADFILYTQTKVKNKRFLSFPQAFPFRANETKRNGNGNFFLSATVNTVFINIATYWKSCKLMTKHVKQVCQPTCDKYSIVNSRILKTMIVSVLVHLVQPHIKDNLWSQRTLLLSTISSIQHIQINNSTWGVTLNSCLRKTP